MAVSEFAERLARVRHRFVSSLESKIEDTYAALPNLAGDDPGVVETVSETYRRIHGICGIGPSIGFVDTGHAARNVENVLLLPYREQRPLQQNEVDQFKRALHALRDAAQRELRATFVGWR